MLTVFTPSYNDSEYLPLSIESVLSQTYTDYEYLIYDDGSTDNSWEIIQHYAKQDRRIKPFYLEKTDNVGVVINKSLMHYKGDAWLWCPGDDIWLPNLLEEKYHFHQAHPDCISYSDWIVIDEFGNEVTEIHPNRFTPSEFRDVVWHDCPIGFTGIWIPRNVFNVVGLFPEHLKFSEDFYWMIKATIHGVDFRCVPEILYKKRKHLNSTTNKNIDSILANIPVIRQELMRYKDGYEGTSSGAKAWYFFSALKRRPGRNRYMTLYSFRKLNPDWEMEVYKVQPNSIKEKTWSDIPVQDFHCYEGEDYSERIEDLDVKIIDWRLIDPDGKDWDQKVGPSQKSNFFKWQKLAEDGGIYSDFDILFTKPIEAYYNEVQNCDFSICYHGNYFSIGFLASSPPSSFFCEIWKNTFAVWSEGEYQAAAVLNLYKLLKSKHDRGLPTRTKLYNMIFRRNISKEQVAGAWDRSLNYWAVIEKEYPDFKKHNMPMNLVYPWKFDQMKEVFEAKNTSIPNDCIGIHWYAGDPLSQKYNCLMNESNYTNFDNTFSHFSSKVILGQL